MPDIRSFFAPKGGSQGSSQPKPASPLPLRTKKTGKKRVIDDSEEEEEAKPVKKTLPKKSVKEEPKEDIDASDYFASTKKKVERTAPVRTSKKKVVKTPSPEPNYFDDDDDEMDDIFIEQYAKTKDDYVEEKPKAKPAAKVKDEDVDMDDDDDYVEEKEENIPPPKVAPAKGKKRKSLSDVESEEEDVKKKPKPAPKAAPKRAPAKKKKEEEPDNSEAQKIIDSIPTVRPPTPPPIDPGKKFNFKDFHNRQNAAPAMQGSKEMPVGEENCLQGLTFVFTGVLETLSREDGQQLVKKYGGKVTTAPSKKTSFVVLGSDAGPKKLATIRENKLKTIDEDGLFQLIRSLPANGGDAKAAQKMQEKKAEEEKKVIQMAKDMAPKSKEEAKQANEQLWTVKYAPTMMNQICGNKGQVEKLQRWLHNWEKNRKADFKKRGEDGSGAHRAVMIHGPPGIGKTTAAHLVANLEGYDVLEFNASDTRSKKLMDETLRGVLDNRSLAGYFAGGVKKVDRSKQKLILIMDEVDGMSAGDRGGVGQLAATCKKTSIPIICICNERRLPKMKPFDHVTFELPFRRPDATAIRSRIASIAYREGLKLPANVIDQLVEGTHSDIRQIINMLSTFKVGSSGTMSFEESKDLSKAWEKHVILKPWDIAGQLLGPQMFAPTSKKTLNDKLELYFNDHEFSYLMIQENYLKTRPARSSNYQGREKNLKELELFSEAADSISDGDLVDALIHGTQQHWSLMPTHGVFSTVKPASLVYGGSAGMFGFTTWLGNNSKAGKLGRYVKEIQSHIRLRTSGDRHEVRQQYLPAFWTMTAKRLEQEGTNAVPEIISLMDDYFLTKEDYDAIIELGVGPMSESNLTIPTNAKSAFTRQYNAMPHPMPFMKASNVVPTAKAKKEVPDLEDAIPESDDEAVVDDNAAAKAEEEEMDISKDKYIKQPKKKAAPKGGAKKAPAKKAPTKGKGKKAAEPEDSEMDDFIDDDEDEPPKKKPAAKGKAKAPAKKAAPKKK